MFSWPLLVDVLPVSRGAHHGRLGGRCPLPAREHSPRLPAGEAADLPAVDALQPAVDAARDPVLKGYLQQQLASFRKTCAVGGVPSG
jgi:hypothetical protein